MGNPLLEDHGLPPFRSIKAEHVLPAIDALLTGNRQVVESLLSKGAAGWQDLFRIIEEHDDGLNRAFAPIRHLNSVLSTAPTGC